MPEQAVAGIRIPIPLGMLPTKAEGIPTGIHGIKRFKKLEALPLILVGTVMGIIFIEPVTLLVASEVVNSVGSRLVCDVFFGCINWLKI